MTVNPKTRPPPMCPSKKNLGHLLQKMRRRYKDVLRGRRLKDKLMTCLNYMVDILCRPKDQGGLGILDLQIQNKCLLAKWIVNLLNTDGMWQELLKNKYLRSKSLMQVKAKPYDSHFWRGLMKIKDEILTNGTFLPRGFGKTLG